MTELPTKQADIFDKYVLREPRPDEWTAHRLAETKGINKKTARRILLKMAENGEAELVTNNGLTPNGNKCNIWRINEA